jgi:hypothetical protein
LPSQALRQSSCPLRAPLPAHKLSPLLVNSQDVPFDLETFPSADFNPPSHDCVTDHHREQIIQDVSSSLPKISISLFFLNPGTELNDDFARWMDLDEGWDEFERREKRRVRQDLQWPHDEARHRPFFNTKDTQHPNISNPPGRTNRSNQRDEQGTHKTRLKRSVY